MPDWERKRLIYGRRQGHKLSPRQQALMDDLLPRIRFNPGKADKLFDFTPQDLWLEIGFGGGEHLLHQAGRHPDTGFIGCEPFINGVAKLLAGIDEQRLENIRIYDDDARDVLDALPPASIGRAFLLYPDPWPKKRHNKRRFINPDNIAKFARVMKEGAILLIASDIPDYIRWILAHMQASPDFEWLSETPDDWRLRPDDWPGTRYEAKAVREGRIPAYLSFARR